MHKPYNDFAIEARRLVLLQALEHAAQYRGGGELLRHWCEQFGHAVSADRLAVDLAWLEEQGLVSLQRTQGLPVATLTERGLDVATGRASVPGVPRPHPVR